MGTNFFIRDTNGETRVRVGRRSAAGLYCWDCRTTLCKGGESAVHTGGAYIRTYPASQWEAERAKEWHGSCPQCHQAPLAEDISESSTGRELGFNKSEPRRKWGVQSCSSFTWAVDPGSLEGIDSFVDEYGSEYTPAQFIQILEECPIQFRNMIGREFS